MSDRQPDLLSEIRSYAPDPKTPVATARKEFLELCLEYQGEISGNPPSSRHEIRPGLVGYRLSVPESSSQKVILFFHGGCFTLGSTADHLGLCTRLARAAEALVFSVDYRLAPEHPFPAAIEDAVAAYRYLIDGGISPRRIVPVGLSSGGTLVISLLLTLRDQGLPVPAAAVCMSPIVDLAFSCESVSRNRDLDWISPEWLATARSGYIAGREISDPLVSPAKASLRGLPPLYIQAGTHEILFDDISAFARKARWAGVQARLGVWEGMFHSWQLFADQLAEGGDAIRHAGEFVRNAVP